MFSSIWKAVAGGDPGSDGKSVRGGACSEVDFSVADVGDEGDVSDEDEAADRLLTQFPVRCVWSHLPDGPARRNESRESLRRSFTDRFDDR